MKPDSLKSKYLTIKGIRVRGEELQLSSVGSLTSWFVCVGTWWRGSLCQPLLKWSKVLLNSTPTGISLGLLGSKKINTGNMERNDVWRCSPGETKPLRFSMVVLWSGTVIRFLLLYLDMYNAHIHRKNGNRTNGSHLSHFCSCALCHCLCQQVDGAKVLPCDIPTLC